MQLHWPNKLDEASFLQQYWQTRPLLIKQAFPELAGAENPISRDELGGLATDEEVTSRIILRESDTKWHCRHGPFKPNELEELPAKDWSLLVSDIEKHLPELQTFLKPFHFIPQWRIDDLMISYAPEGASVGAHIDNYDVFLLQAAGKREWSITENPEADRSLLPDLEIGVLANFEAENTWVLEPGDMLYLPPGTPHHGVSLDNDCMTWSIGFRAPSHREIVTEIAEHLAAQIPEGAFYSDPGILLHEHSGQISPNVVTRLREVWNTYVHPSNEEFEHLAGRLITHSSDTDESVKAAPTVVTEESQDKKNLTDIARTALGAMLEAEETWERDSFAKFAFVLQSRFAEQEETPKGKMLKKIKATVIRSSTGNDVHPDDGTEEHLADTTLNNGGVEEPEKKSPRVLLFVNGNSVECSERLATVLTGEYQHAGPELLDACSDEQDCLALQWLIESRFIQSVS